jgi:hypothetical protein
VRCADCGREAAGPRIGPIARRQLEALLEGAAPSGLGHARQHLGLLTDFVAHHVASRPLKSLRFLGDMLPADAQAADV